MLYLGIYRKIGDLKRLAGACRNDGVCGLIRQYTWNLTTYHKRIRKSKITFYRYCMAVVSSCFEVWRLVVQRAQPVYTNKLLSFSGWIDFRIYIRYGKSQVIMVYIKWATHAPQRKIKQRVANINMGANLQKFSSSGRRLKFTLL
jgi:hypothetical protein